MSEVRSFTGIDVTGGGDFLHSIDCRKYCWLPRRMTDGAWVWLGYAYERATGVFVKHRAVGVRIRWYRDDPGVPAEGVAVLNGKLVDTGSARVMSDILEGRR
ncbi:hypothetical protein [Castellaniella sp.]|uniref:hypothetical protein n=1 Tax=Castellaniella sp. TaxID=1955812 RepID=UPI002AFEA13C|nr:hypothetical protein [Castellaniella sp.]